MPEHHAAALMALLLDLTHTLSVGVLGRERFGANADDLLLLCAVGAGRPSSAHKLADQAGIPRPTVVRKLGELEAAGLVQRLDGGRYMLAPGVMDSQGAAQAMEAARRRVVAVAGRLG